jgi:MFS-type transporter involved in bile tolerance (Atg22 family)
MLAELCPRGKENLFFGLFGVINKGSSWLGPVVVSAITEHTDNLWKGWPFVLALFVVAIVIVFFIDVDKAKIETENYLANEQHALEETDTNKVEVAESTEVQEKN